MGFACCIFALLFAAGTTLALPKLSTIREAGGTVAWLLLPIIIVVGFVLVNV